MNPTPPPFDQISVVVQGPVFGEPDSPHEEAKTLRVVESIRRTMPGAEIILSTWEGSETSHLNVDKIVLSKDPGGWICHTNGSTYNNVNRLLVSTQKGLEQVNRPYAVKTRSDCEFINADFVSSWTAFPIRSDQLKLTKERVIATSFFTVNPLKFNRWASYHISDWFSFGLTEDVRAIWSAPLMPREMATWYQTHPLPANAPNDGFICRFRPEQWIWSNFVKSKMSIDYEDAYDCSANNTIITLLLIVNNLILLEPEHIGINPLKVNIPPPDNRQNFLFTFNDWNLAYQILRI